MNLLLQFIYAILSFYLIQHKICTAVTVKFQDVNVEYINGEYIDEDSFDTSVNYINETYNTLSFRATFIKEFPPNLHVKLSIYAYAFGDFRIPMGITVDADSCDLKSKPIFFAPFILAVGGDLDKCGPELREYKNESFYPVDLSMVPNLLPKNKYKGIVDVSNSEVTILKMQIFAEIL